MSYCYTEMDNPDFFANNSNCGDLKHDLKVVGGDLHGDKYNHVISAILIQLNTHSGVLDKNEIMENGWWGDEFSTFKVGNDLWNINKIKDRNDRLAMTESSIRQSLEPIVNQGLIDDVDISITQVVGGVDVEIGIIKNGESIFKVTK